MTFLDVFLKRTATNQIETCVCRKRQALICISTGIHTRQWNGKLEH